MAPRSVLHGGVEHTHGIDRADLADPANNSVNSHLRWDAVRQRRWHHITTCIAIFVVGMIALTGDHHRAETDTTYVGPLPDVMYTILIQTDPRPVSDWPIPTVRATGSSP
ncbi:hypothetical protein ACFQ1S_18090 [Kibdelosporangium lantanae]|uniref:Uncharacterized protein n=1 Tax=Kibdelosporangium lantanae TaxID=1497396 RepID=A0ABW3MEA3_9PSEU